MKGIAGAIAFLTRIPIKTDVNPANAVGDFPVVGYMAGGIYILLFWILGRSLPVIVLSIFLVYFLFNAFHFDGLLDTTDAFMSQKQREKKLEIMKMGNSGPMAILVGALYMILMTYVLGRVSFVGILASTVSGRYAMVLTAYFSKPAKSGLGASIFPVRLKTLIHASVYLVPFLFFPRTLLFIGIGLVAAFAMKLISDRMIGGMTGDVLGSIEEIAQIVVLTTCQLR
ncbi:adenosylcobinamide-GDP ribazoletransferase [Athalassotoga sp.]|uniref:adenosylcobinamide-GDP ribazoletransferase n=1 Tax=Athalassotoga sp. TaxID=2022597 RepID=UPI003D0358D9